MEEKKILTVEVTSEQLNALTGILFGELSGYELEVLKTNAFMLLNTLSVAYDNANDKSVDFSNLSEASKLIEVQQNRIFELEREEISFPLRLYSALEGMFDHDHAYKLQPPAEMNVFDEEFKFFRRKFPIMPEHVICIVSAEKKRKKIIYTTEENTDGTIAIKKYLFNNNEYNFDELCKLLDKLSHRLIRVSKSAIVNVAFYNIGTDNYLRLCIPNELLADVENIKISNKKSEYDTFKSDFIKVKDLYRRHVLTQNRIIGYNTLVELAFPNIASPKTVH
jgi:hypothetical protein